MNSSTPFAVVIAAVVYCILSPLEHKRSVRPSTPIILFLTVNLLGETARWVLADRHPDLTIIGRSIKLAIVINLLLLFLESFDKSGMLLDPAAVRSPEDTAGVLSRTFFWWINAILARGYYEKLEVKTLPDLDEKLASTSLRSAALHNWEQRSRSFSSGHHDESDLLTLESEKPESLMTLPRVLLRTLLGPFLGAILPRLFLTVFKYSQPLLIRQTIRFLVNSHSKVGLGPEEGSNIIMASIIVYSGLAVGHPAVFA